VLMIVIIAATLPLISLSCVRDEIRERLMYSHRDSSWTAVVGLTLSFIKG
jgi:hypothetical protein